MHSHAHSGTLNPIQSLLLRPVQTYKTLLHDFYSYIHSYSRRHRESATTRVWGVDRINITPSQIHQKVFKGLWPLTPENFSLFLLHRLKMLLIKCHLALSPLSSLLSTSRIWLIPQAQHVKVYFLSPYILRVLLAHPTWPHR